MGREFLEVFTGWAEEYDAFVEGQNEEYRAVFKDYEEILDAIVSKSGESVLEFGIGTGNLTAKLVDASKRVYPVEPSEEMRQLAQEKLPKTLTLIDGDMQRFPLPDFPIDTIVSSYVFHHLTDTEKAEAMRNYVDLLEENGKVIFADTLFVSQQAFDQMIEQAEDLQYHELVADLKREYYSLLENMYSIFKQAGLTKISFTQMNEFVWIVEGRKESSFDE